MLRNLGINHLVALLGFILSVCSYLALKRYGAPDKVCVGAAILCILVVSIFWSCVLLGADDDED
ncbi:MAG: hypothetical protein JSS86_05625 [Cyanobacteria bacterium SZAS LIN-2]|nr:hypothetical protein [Cyanobacteria bacterium SZAS LIN-3]MBS1995766.1 hypothetical protein [Cyanobacteria bacterium SZAS LIN-2]MBS2006397.1 hypothetical protein [Cyanobacteria bacterium SZAS TMP-1]